MQRVVRVVTVLAVLTVGPTIRSAVAHISPSQTENNRYLKLTPVGDRVRLAYTVFYGEEPGARIRPTLDSNRDGQISDAEATFIGSARAGEVADALELTLDGKTIPVAWTTVAVGMGSPSATAGAFSIDLVATFCLPGSGPTHTLMLRDRFRIPDPGETEAKFEDAPGVTIDHSHVGVISDPGHDYKFVGPGGPLLDDGIEVKFTVSATAPSDYGRCSVAGSARSIAPLWMLALIGAVVAGMAFFMFRRR